MSTLKLKSIGEEAKACRAAFENIKIGALVWHCHHEKLAEFLTSPPEHRISFILSDKPEHERALRLRLFRPVRTKNLPKYLKEACAKWEDAYAKRQEAYAKWQEAYAKRQEACAKWQEAYAKWEEAYAKWQEAYAKRQEAYAKELHAKQCPNCPWDGKTIFP